MLHWLERFCLNFTHWICCEISWFSFNSSCLVFNYFFFILRVLFLVLIWTIHKCFIARSRLKLIFMKTWASMHFSFILNLLFVSLFVRISLQNTWGDLKIWWFINSSLARAWEHLSWFSDGLSVLSFCSCIKWNILFFYL